MVSCSLPVADAGDAGHRGRFEGPHKCTAAFAKSDTMTLCRSTAHPIYIKATQRSNERSAVVFIEELISFFISENTDSYLPRDWAGCFPPSSILGPSAFCVWCHWYQSECLSAQRYMLIGFSDSNSKPLTAWNDYLQHFHFITFEFKKGKQTLNNGYCTVTQVYTGTSALVRQMWQPYCRTVNPSWPITFCTQPDRSHQAN